MALILICRTLAVIPWWWMSSSSVVVFVSINAHFVEPKAFPKGWEDLTVFLEKVCFLQPKS
jgi:hypothetical protein